MSDLASHREIATFDDWVAFTVDRVGGWTCSAVTLHSDYLSHCSEEPKLPPRPFAYRLRDRGFQPRVLPGGIRGWIMPATLPPAPSPVPVYQWVFLAIVAALYVVAICACLVHFR